jgi:cytochrome b6-f complex iron-sulfur subunit
MSNTAVIAIGIGVVVVLAAIAFITTARRSDIRGAGALSGETRKRDAAARKARAEAEAQATRADDPVAVGTGLATREEAEAAGVAARRGTVVGAGRQGAMVGAGRQGAMVAAPPTAPAPWTPPDPEAIGVSRRQFFNRATVSLMSAGLGAFAAASFVAFLWPSAKGGFGQNVNIGKLQDIIDGARSSSGFFYAPAARAWVTEYPADALPKAEAVYDPRIYQGMADYGIVALYQKCPHLGCRVPSCATSGWFECPCHGSQYNRVGEKKAGPAPRGMDSFPFTVDPGGNVIVATGTVITGQVIGTNTTGQEAEGPHCITGAGGH